MKTKQVVESELESLEDYDFLFFRDELDEVQPVNNENIEEAATAWGVSTKLVKDLRSSFNFMRDELIEKIKSDMEDIWEQVTE